MKQFLFFIFILINTIANAQIKGKVISVTDGDSFTILTEDRKQQKVKLYGVDTPENGQAYASKAKAFLIKHISNKDVTIQVKGNKKGTGYTTGIVTVDGVTINELVLTEGMAWHYKKEDKSAKYERMEQEARQEKKGLWGEDEKPVAPWEFRRTNESKK